MSKLERIVFSGKEEHFLYFAEQLKARIFHLKLIKLHFKLIKSIEK